jgi:hypothetical protein
MIFSRPLRSPRIPQDPPEDAAEEHPDHLHVEEEDPLVDEFLAGKPQPFQARDADNAEKNQVVDVDEITESGNDDGKRKNGADAYFGAVHQTLLISVMACGAADPFGVDYGACKVNLRKNIALTPPDATKKDVH